MKKILALIFTFSLLLSSFAGCTKDNGTKPTETTSGDHVVTTPETTPSISDTESTEYTYTTWLSDGNVKVKGEDKAPKDVKTSITVYMAKNEKEAFNLSRLSTLLVLDFS